MSLGQVIIDEMNLNIPGLSQMEADLLGHDVVKQINYLLKKNEIPQRAIDHMALRVEVPHGTPKEELANVIANKICKSLI